MILNFKKTNINNDIKMEINNNEKNDIKHNIAASVSFFGNTTAISNLNVDEIANSCVMAMKIAKTPKSEGEKNRVNIGNNNNGINCEKPTPVVNTNISFIYFELTNSLYIYIKKRIIDY